MCYDFLQACSVHFRRIEQIDAVGVVRIFRRERCKIAHLGGSRSIQPVSVPAYANCRKFISFVSIGFVIAYKKPVSIRTSRSRVIGVSDNLRIRNLQAGRIFVCVIEDPDTAVVCAPAVFRIAGNVLPVSQTVTVPPVPRLDGD